MFSPSATTLRYGSAEEAGLSAAELDRIVPDEEAFLAPGPDRPDPSHPGFVVLVARNGVIALHEARGYAVRYERWDADSGHALDRPADQWVPMRPDTIFDLASLSKLFTSVAAAQLMERGAIDLDGRVADYLPAFGTDVDKRAITVRHLLTHTSGMVSWLDLASLGSAEERLDAIHAEPLRYAPGTGYEYSDLNLIVLARLLTAVTGTPLDQLVADQITEPLGMTETRYNPPESLLPRIAATEDQSWTGRGLIHGTVHDENAWSFGGVSGHAGLFSTATDLAIFAQLIVGGGRYGNARILGEDWARTMLTNHNDGLDAPAARGLGWQLDQRYYMDDLASPLTAGHTGYTGTSLVIDLRSAAFAILLTNRVHPTRQRGTESAYRRVVARGLARALAAHA